MRSGCSVAHALSALPSLVSAISDVPLGFGITAYSTKECRKVESTAVIAFHQADIGEYLRSEEEL